MCRCGGPCGIPYFLSHVQNGEHEEEEKKEQGKTKLYKSGIGGGADDLFCGFGYRYHCDAY